MSADIREYLIERFRGDATTLRQRATSLAGAKKPSPGPDAALSHAMATACEDVVALAEQLPVNAPLDEIVAALQAMLSELSKRANSPAASAAPALRSVYAGATTRVQELITAEKSALASQSAGVDDSTDDGIDESDLDDLEADDPDADDDDLPEDEDDESR